MQLCFKVNALRLSLMAGVANRCALRVIWPTGRSWGASCCRGWGAREGRLGLTSCPLCPTAVASLSLRLPQSTAFLFIQVSALSQGQLPFMSPDEEMGGNHFPRQEPISGFLDIATSWDRLQVILEGKAPKTHLSLQVICRLGDAACVLRPLG